MTKNKSKEFVSALTKDLSADKIQKKKSLVKGFIAGQINMQITKKSKEFVSALSKDLSVDDKKKVKNLLVPCQRIRWWTNYEKK